MIDFKHISQVYFVGIGGIGMSALARYFNYEGKIVAGYDRTSSHITTALIEEGIAVTFEDTVSTIPQPFLNTRDTIVVYTPAIPKSNQQLGYFRALDYQIAKRAQILGSIANASYCIAVAGTHGKTTTSGILGHLLAESGAHITAFIGGITQNYKSNLIYKGNEAVVVEADEFDRSFLSLQPDIACITSMDADHLDIYGNVDEIELTFKAFAKSVTAPQKLFIKNGLPIAGNTVGIADDSDYSAQNIRIKDGVYVFDFVYPKGVIKDMHFNLPGWHNLFNAVTALGMAIAYGTPTDRLPEALLSFSGVNRRFTYRFKQEHKTIIDDYAHHPTEIAAVHQSIREMYPGRKALAIFQPHLFSRTKDFMNAFAQELSRFDAVCLLDIYPARELPISGITSAVLLDKISCSRKQLMDKEKVPDFVLQCDYPIVVMMGAGDISETILKTTEVLENAF